MNKAAETILGYQAENLIGRETPLIFHDPVEVAAYDEELSIINGKRRVLLLCDGRALGGT